MSKSETPQTKRDSYEAIKNAGDDVTLRKRVAATIAMQPATTAELADRWPDRSANAIRPRVNELIRMGCVERRGTRENPSGHDAYIHHITPKGKRYLRNEIDPEPDPTLTELQSTVVDVARSYCHGDASKDELEQAVKNHDGAKLRREPDWNPPYVPDSERKETDGLDHLTEEEIEQIENDPVLELSDFRG